MDVSETLGLIYDDRQVVEALDRLKAALGELSSPLSDIGEEALRRIDIQFEREVDPFGNPWRSLAPGYLDWKKENSRIAKILQSTGRLRASITYAVLDEILVIGTNVDYARKHQLGEGVYQRLIFGVDDEFKDEILAIIVEWLMYGSEAGSF